MNFDELNAHIPYVTEGKLHSLETEIIDKTDYRVTALSPGKYKDKTEVPGGDFVVVVTCKTGGWDSLKFKHDHLFDDIELKTKHNTTFMQQQFAPALADVIVNRETPAVYRFLHADVPGIQPTVLLYASQALALAEHRRYARYESGGGGRFLPARFALGIIYGHWTANEAKLVQYNGKPGLQKLITMYGEPPKIRDLANTALV